MSDYLTIRPMCNSLYAKALPNANLTEQSQKLNIVYSVQHLVLAGDFNVNFHFSTNARL